MRISDKKSYFILLSILKAGQSSKFNNFNLSIFIKLFWNKLESEFISHAINLLFGIESIKLIYSGLISIASQNILFKNLISLVNGISGLFKI